MKSGNKNYKIGYMKWDELIQIIGDNTEYNHQLMRIRDAVATYIEQLETGQQAQTKLEVKNKREIPIPPPTEGGKNIMGK